MQRDLFEQALVERDDAMARVAQAAEDRRPDFGAEAQAFIVSYLKSRGPTPGEVLTMECKRAGISAHDDRAFGPVFHTLARRGLIRIVGTVRRARGHGTTGGNIWGAV